jgi:L-ascorbate metabolism protein UlaG (beta-lactamase superfamily)
MDIYWYGQAMFKLKGKNATVLIDPFDPAAIGLKLPKPSDLEADIVLKTHDHPDHNNLAAIPGDPVKIEGPGEYEAKGVSVIGTSVFHDNQEGAERGKNTVYTIVIDGLNIVHLGDLGHTLSESQVEEIGSADILLIPVGSVYTIDAKAATEVVSELEPRIIIPMHYLIPGLTVPLEGVDNFLKEMGAENPEALNKLSITKDKLPEEPQVVVLNKS